MRLDLHFKYSLWLLHKEDKRGARGQQDSSWSRRLGWLRERHAPSQYIHLGGERLGNDCPWGEGRVNNDSSKTLTSIYLTFKVVCFLPRLLVISLFFPRQIIDLFDTRIKEKRMSKALSMSPAQTEMRHYRK